MAKATSKTTNTNSSAKSTAKIKEADGVVYVFPNGQVIWENPEITIDTMEKLRINADAQSLQTKLTNLIFPVDPPIIEVLNEQEKNDEDVAARLRKMIDKPEVNFYTQMKNYFIDSCYSAFLYSLSIERAEDGFIEITEFRDLPASSFNISGYAGREKGHSVLLPGIVLQEDGVIHYYQTDQDGIQNELKNVNHMRPPGRDTDLIGLPLFYNLAPFFMRLDFSYLSLMQTVNRVGAPSIFLRITQPGKGDIETAKKILQNWGKNNSFTIPGNFEVVEIGTRVNDVALRAIDLLNKRLSNHFSPSDFIATDGTLFGGSDEAKADLLIKLISGFHKIIVENFKPLLQMILDYNGYKGYKIDIHFPKPEIKSGQLDFERAKDAAEKGTITINEYRVKLGFEPMKTEDIKQCKTEWKEHLQLNKTAQPTFGQANSATNPNALKNNTAATNNQQNATAATNNRQKATA